MKNPFKKKDKFPTPSAPRPMEEIQKEFQQLIALAANAQYTKFIKEEELKQINHRLVQVNQEGKARNELDAAKAAETAKAAQQLAVQPGEANGKA